MYLLSFKEKERYILFCVKKILRKSTTLYFRIAQQPSILGKKKIPVIHGIAQHIIIYYLLTMHCLSPKIPTMKECTCTSE